MELVHYFQKASPHFLDDPPFWFSEVGGQNTWSSWIQNTPELSEPWDFENPMYYHIPPDIPLLPLNNIEDLASEQREQYPGAIINDGKANSVVIWNPEILSIS